MIWASSTPPNDPSVSAALKACCGTDWDGKFLINAEFNVLDSGKPDQNHMNEIREKYAVEHPVVELRSDGLPRRPHGHRGAARDPG